MIPKGPSGTRLKLDMLVVSFCSNLKSYHKTVLKCLVEMEDEYSKIHIKMMKFQLSQKKMTGTLLYFPETHHLSRITQIFCTKLRSILQ